MGFIVIGTDGPRGLAHRLAVRPRHRAVIERWADEGLLAFSGPTLDAAGTMDGSLIAFRAPDMAVMQRYIAEEPYAQEGVWGQHQILPYSIPALPFRPLPGTPGGPPAPLAAFAVTLFDPTDAGALDRRLAARPTHLAYVAEEARAGRLVLGGALLDAPGGRAIGSIVVLALPDQAAVEAWLAADPYGQAGIWGAPKIQAMQVAGLPYHPLG
jgi:uncharacterized protein YciI